MDMDKWMYKWADTPGTLEHAVMTLSPEEISTGLRILSNIKGYINLQAAQAGVAPEEWDGATADELLEAFLWAEGENKV